MDILDSFIIFVMVLGFTALVTAPYFLAKKLFKKKSKQLDGINVLIKHAKHPSINRALDVINESLEISENTKNIETKISRLNTVKTTLERCHYLLATTKNMNDANIVFDHSKIFKQVIDQEIENHCISLANEEKNYKKDGTLKISARNKLKKIYENYLSNYNLTEHSEEIQPLKKMLVDDAETKEEAI